MERSREILERVTKYAVEIGFPLLTTKVDILAKFVIKELPKLEGLLLEIFEIMFSPRQLIRQLVIVTAVQLMIMAGETVANIGTSLVIFLSKAEREQQEVMKELSQAVSYQEWKKVAARLDYMRSDWYHIILLISQEFDFFIAVTVSSSSSSFLCRGYDKWRLQDESSLFDCNVLKKRINDTVEMVRQGDVFRLMFRLRGGLARDQYGNLQKAFRYVSDLLE